MRSYTDLLKLGLKIYMDKAQEILDAAKAGITDRARFRDANGKKSMDVSVAIFNLLTDRDLSVRDGWEFMKIVKQVRSQQGEFHLDDYVDEAAYCALAGEAHNGQVRPTRNGPSKVGSNLPQDEGDVYGPNADEAKGYKRALVDMLAVSGIAPKENDE